MKDYRVVAKIKNNRILARIDALGFTSVSAFSKANNLRYTAVSSFITMRCPPSGLRGNWSKTAMDLATALRVQPEDLFNDRQKLGNANSVITREMDEPTISLQYTSIEDRLLPSPDEAVTARVDAEHLMECLKPRERRAIEMLFGLNGNLVSTFKEIGEEFGVTAPRVEQIVANGMRRMRHPSIAGGYLKPTDYTSTYAN